MKGGVRKRGNKWYYYFDAGIVDGKRKKIERVGGATKKEAQDALRKALNEFERAGSFIDESNISVSDYFDFWYKDYVEVNCKFYTQRTHRSTIENHIKPDLGVYKLKSITPARLQEFINNKFKEGYSKETLKELKSVLNNAFKMAVYPYQYIKENPMLYINMPRYKNSKKEIDVFTLDEFNRILDKYPFGHKCHIPLLIGFHTGLRASEVCGLTWDNIDFKNKTITVDKIMIVKKSKDIELQSPKTQSSYRTILIGDTLYSALKKHRLWQSENKLKYGEFYIKNEHDFVCTEENGKFVTPVAFRGMSAAIKSLGIQFNFHKLRHTHATLCLVAGANIKDIQERLGHSKISTTMDIYSHVTDELKKETVDIFENAIK